MSFDMEIRQELEINCPPERLWEALTRETSSWWTAHEVVLTLEPRVGGRLYRDLSGTHGEGAGHYWGTVQVFKPPRLLEIVGPLMISLPSISHMTFRVEERGGGSVLKFVQLTSGAVPPEFLDGAHKGWAAVLEGLKSYAEH